MFLKNSKKIIIFLIVTLSLLMFFSYHLTQIPFGINQDEAAVGYNGILLSRTLHDENGRKLPIFVLSMGGKDWKQPVTQYFTVVIFKIFGPSLFNLRMTAVITTVASILLIYFLGKRLMGNTGAIAAAIFLATTPIIMIQSHLAFDNIAPVPFVIIWLLGLLLFSQNKKYRWLFLSAVSLGIGFYSYKAMRLFVPVWTILSLIYLSESFLTKISKNNFKKVFKPVLIFALSILPFFAIIPFLEFLYAGAVLNNAGIEINNIYSFIYPYFSTFDPSFLFIKGDDLLIHSTGRHGMYLLMSLPFFILGLISSWKKSNFWKLLTVSFFLGPLMFGYIGQIHRASRLLAEVPLYALISAVGFLTLWQRKAKILIVIFVLFFTINYFDFIHYYLGSFAADTANLYSCFSCTEGAFKILKYESIKRGLTPYVDQVVMNGLDSGRDFAKTIYFTGPVNTWDGVKADLSDSALLMTDNSNVSYLKQIDHFDRYYFYIKK
jgi:4-amino-4-deoxy-L-arabinose transferase-like glycosyltransferase